MDADWTSETIWRQANPGFGLTIDVPCRQWIRDGQITATRGEVVDYDHIRRAINELGSKYAIQQIAIDGWNTTQLAVQLEGGGFEIFEFGQGSASMSALIKKLEELVLSRQRQHGEHPVLRWMAGNVSLETDAVDNWKPGKKKSGDGNDDIVALIMALDLATTHITEPGPCDNRWLIFI